MPDGAGWERWRQVAAKGGAEVFGRRLRWAGLEPEAARRLTGPATVDPAAPLPPWALTLQEIADRVADGVDASGPCPPPCDEGEPIPFEHLLEPAVRVARARLRGRCARQSGRDPLPLFSEAAHRTLERALVRRLAAITAQALYLEFRADRPYALTLLGMFDEHADELAGRERYVRFIERMSSDGLLGFFRKYPVAARLMATAVNQWADTTAEMLGRLEADVDAIERSVLAESESAGRKAFVVTEIETSLSDPHRGGRTVAALTLADGRKFVYKPKSLGLEVAFNRLLDWFNAGGCGEKLRVVRVLDRGEYGWVEHIAHEPCPNLEGARRFYRRAGMLLCVLHVLRATDCHHGNVIASGEHPVLVDAETLLHPSPRTLDAHDSISKPDAITQAFLGSVLRPLFLPAWHVSGDGQVAYDVSALGGSGGDPLPQKLPDWRWINSDVMVLGNRIGTVPAEKNAVRVGERVLDPTDFQSEIMAGFEEMWREVERRREALLREGSPLTAMRALPTRFLFRPTHIYLSLLMSACSPEHLAGGARFSIELDHLSRAFVMRRTRPSVRPILDAELRALGQLDVPYFEGRANSDALEIGDGPTVPRYFRRAGYDEALEGMSRLDDADLRWQLALISGSFQARVARNDKSMEAVNEPAAQRALTPAEMRAEAERLAEELDRRGISDERGETNWLGLGLAAETERVQLRLIGDSLYEGRCGVALFLAALHRFTGAPRLRELAHEALASVRRLSRTILAESSGHPDRPEPPELGWMIYALVKTGELLGDPEPLHHARVLAGSITPADAASDTAFDVLSGSAGVVLGLLSLHRTGDDSAALATAEAFGLHLLEHRVSHEGAPRAWQTMGNRPLAGFSHGAAGIAFALLRLYDACADERFRAAALEAIEYERAVFSPSEGNWPDLREVDNGDAPAFPDQWCHGAAGIALARLGSRELVPDPTLGAEVEVALGTTQRVGLKAVDHLCCGNMGRIEALWAGAQRMGRSDWRDAALAYASQARERAHRAGTYQLFPNLPCDVFNPGFFRGVAGIGYQWLRLAEPKLPSVLLWE